MLFPYDVAQRNASHESWIAAGQGASGASLFQSHSQQSKQRNNDYVKAMEHGGAQQGSRDLLTCSLS